MTSRADMEKEKVMGRDMVGDYEKMLADSLKTRDDMVVRMALASIYKSLQENADFWVGWITLRTGPMADMGMFTPEEVVAAESLGEGIEAIAAAFKIMEIPKREDD